MLFFYNIYIYIYIYIYIKYLIFFPNRYFFQTSSENICIQSEILTLYIGLDCFMLTAWPVVTLSSASALGFLNIQLVKESNTIDYENKPLFV